ncbi:RNA-binding protein [Methylosinus trichosporium]|uniref:DNA-binding protein n=1 Tax=Methylosinus trichosporium (strain ATCC 35070 / NCIMB 11131 / UNIQEM 75 / OB3b) TaxID=595536 RepID=A0A2D2D062_METT3|nr:RNA-binding protein [Methylosinus trichosporium]ATQ68375.1 DNA-binding protein [Methylosinus trichosporium OB3b]
MRDAEASERMCIVTRRRDAPEAMIRFVRAPDGVLTPDIRARLPGRGAWVTGRSDLVAEALKKRAFARQLKAEISVSPTLPQDVDRLLETDCLQSLALANKAGAVTTGFGKVCDALEKGAVAAVLEARDGSSEGRRKLAQAARRAASAAGGAAEPPATIALFDSSQLGLALGRTNVIHAALAPGGPTQAFLTRCRRLSAYRGENARNQAEESGDDHANTVGPTADANEPAQPEDRKLDE